MVLREVRVSGWKEGVGVGAGVGREGSLKRFQRVEMFRIMLRYDKIAGGNLIGQALRCVKVPVKSDADPYSHGWKILIYRGAICALPHRSTTTYCRRSAFLPAQWRRRSRTKDMRACGGTRTFAISTSVRLLKSCSVLQNTIFLAFKSEGILFHNIDLMGCVQSGIPRRTSSVNRGHDRELGCHKSRRTHFAPGPFFTPSYHSTAPSTFLSS